MTTTKAKYIGVFYTFLVVFIQIFTILSFLVLILSDGLTALNPDDLRYIYQFADKAIPIMLLAAYFFGRKIGPHLLYNLHDKQKTSTVLQKTTNWSIIISYFMFFNMVTYQEHGFELDRIWEIFTSSFGVAFATYCLMYIPSNLLASVLKWLITRHKP